MTRKPVSVYSVRTESKLPGTGRVNIPELMICAIQKQQQEHKLTLQSIQKSFSKFYSSNKECAVIPDTNTIGYVVFVWIKVHTVVKYEMLTFTVAYVAHNLQRQEIIPRCVPPLQT